MLLGVAREQEAATVEAKGQRGAAPPLAARSAAAQLRRLDCRAAVRPAAVGRSVHHRCCLCRSALPTAPPLARRALRHVTLCSLMGQAESNEDARLLELMLMIIDAQQRVHRLQPLAAAEEAANVPPTPGSRQAAYHAALQHYAMLSHERYVITCRVDELREGAPNPRPMPRQRCLRRFKLLQRTGPSPPHQKRWGRAVRWQARWASVAAAAARSRLQVVLLRRVQRAKLRRCSLAGWSQRVRACAGGSGRRACDRWGADPPHSQHLCSWHLASLLVVPTLALWPACPPPHASSLTPADHAKLRALWSDGWAAGEIVCRMQWRIRWIRLC
ncbi:hypothetical protein ABPG75_011050 [Micractinium tetrahymenae]